MARKKKVATNTTSSEAPGPGHNKPELTEDEQRVLLYQHKRLYEAADAAVKNAKPDADNLVKLVKDALNTVAWRDDAQVASSHAWKKWGDIAYLRVRIVGLA